MKKQLVKNKKRNRHYSSCDSNWSDPGGTRTHDPLIKSQLLYQLSYGVNDLSIAVQRYCFFLNHQQF